MVKPMNKKATIPSIIFIIQLLGIFYLLYEYKFGNSHIPVAFILLNLFAVFGVSILFSSCFWYFKATEKNVIWKLVFGISVASILFFGSNLPLHTCIGLLLKLPQKTELLVFLHFLFL